MDDPPAGGHSLSHRRHARRSPAVLMLGRPYQPDVSELRGASCKAHRYMSTAASSHARPECARRSSSNRPWVRSPSARPSRRPSNGEQLVAQAHVDRSADLGAVGPAFRLARSAFFMVFAACFKISRRYAAGTQLVVVVARSCLKLSELTCGVSASRHSSSQQTRKGADCKIRRRMPTQVRILDLPPRSVKGAYLLP